MASQNRLASSAFDSLSRNTTSTRPPAKISSAIWSTRDAASWRSRLAMASRSLLAISAAIDSATPSTSDQVRRRLTNSPCRGFGNSVSAYVEFCGGETGRQFFHHAGAFDPAHRDPSGDFVDRATAAQADAGTGIESADLDARTFDHELSVVIHHRVESW